MKKQNVVIFVFYKCQIWLTRRLIFCIYGTSFYYVLHSTKLHLIIIIFQIQTQGYLKMRFTKNSLEIDTIWKMIVTFAGIFSTVKCFSVLERFVEAWNKYFYGSEKRKKGVFFSFFTKCQLNISAFQNYNLHRKVYLLAYLSFLKND